MSDQLTGRALDEAVLGILLDGLCDNGMAGRLIKLNTDGTLYRYSTDPATISEMLAWLPDSLELTRHRDGWVAKAWLAYPVMVTATGAMLNEALSRLVVEVARKRGKK